MALSSPYFDHLQISLILVSVSYVLQYFYNTFRLYMFSYTVLIESNLYKKIKHKIAKVIMNKYYVKKIK